MGPRGWEILSPPGWRDRIPGQLKTADVIEEGADSEDKGTALRKRGWMCRTCHQIPSGGEFRCPTVAKSSCW